MINVFCFLCLCFFFAKKKKKSILQKRAEREKKLNVHFFAVEREGKNLHTQSF